MIYEESKSNRTIMFQFGWHLKIELYNLIGYYTKDAINLKLELAVKGLRVENDLDWYMHGEFR